MSLVTILKLRKEVAQLKAEITSLRAVLNRVSFTWREHQKTKFRSDGSHFQADIKLNGLTAEIDKLLNPEAPVVKPVQD